MGNTSRGFLVALLTFILPLLVFLNLMAFGNIGPFADLQADGEVYVGVSSFLDSLQYFDALSSSIPFIKEFTSPSNVDKFLTDFNNILFFGWPKFIEYISNLDGNTGFFNFSWDVSSFPTFPSFNLNTSDILQAIKELFNLFVGTFRWFYDVFMWFANGLGTIFIYIKTFVIMCIQPILVIIYLCYFLIIVFCYIFLLFAYVVMLMGGYITKPMPSTNKSSWEDIASNWQDEWDNLSYLAKVYFAPLKSARL